MDSSRNQTSVQFTRTQFNNQQYDERKIIQSLQQKKICEEVGIQDSTKYKWFFDQIKTIKMSTEYQKRLTDGKLTYVNKITRQQSHMHPNIHIFKRYFYEQTSNNKTVATFNQKSRKLLPFVENKLIKQFVGLTSKRKQIEKINQKKDSKGKLVDIKTKRITPKTDNLLATRNYLLKGIVQKYITLKELWGEGKKARQFADLLLHKQNAEIQQLEQEQQQQALIDLKKIYEQACYYYQNEFGVLQSVPKKLQSSLAFKLLTPQVVVKCIHILGIPKESIQQYWLGQIMSCLPLPPMWIKLKGTAFDQFYYQPKKMIFDIHPSMLYMVNQLSSFKRRYEKLENIEKNYYLGFRELEFIDFLERPFTVDMYKLVKQHQEQVNNQKIKICNNQSFKTESKYLNAKNSIQFSNDWMILEGIKNSGLDFQQLTMIQYIEKFWKSIDYDEQIWMPSVSPYGQILWNNNISGVSTDICPYQRELKLYLQSNLNNIIKIEEEDYKSEYLAYVSAIKQFEQCYIKKYEKQKKQFLSHYIQNQLSKKEYLICHNIKKQTYFNVVFNCPFDFQKQLMQQLRVQGQSIPLWLEKIQAKRYKQNFLAMLREIPDQSPSIKYIESFVKQSYIKSTKLNQIQNFQSVKHSIDHEMNKDQIIRLVNIAFDIEARQQRVKRLRMNKEIIQKNKQTQQSEEEQPEFNFSNNSNLVQQSKQQNQENIKIVENEAKNILLNVNQIIQQQKYPIQQPSLTLNQKDESIDISKISKNYSSQELSIIENQSPQIENQEQLDKRITELKYKKIKVDKYKINKKNFEVVQKINKIQNTNLRLDYKKKLVSSNLSKQKLLKKRNIQQEVAFKKSKLESLQPSVISEMHSQLFQSCHSGYHNQDIHNMIGLMPKKKQKQQVIQPIFLDQSLKKLPKQKSPKNLIIDEHLRMKILKKQTIKQDPILRHINQIQNVQDFQKTFFKTQSTDISQSRSRFQTARKVAQNKELPSTNFQQNYTTTARVIRRVNQFNKFSADSKQVFKRKCLTSSASHLLNSCAVATKLEFANMEVRKDLQSRGRGFRKLLD